MNVRNYYKKETTMIEAIKNILRKWGCCHEWECRQGCKIVNENRDVIGYKYLYICKKCGKIRWLES